MGARAHKAQPQGSFAHLRARAIAHARMIGRRCRKVPTTPVACAFNGVGWLVYWYDSRSAWKDNVLRIQSNPK
jgi:hypothetical protein